MGKNKNGLTDEELKAEREREVKKENLPRKLIKAIFSLWRYVGFCGPLCIIFFLNIQDFLTEGSGIRNILTGGHISQRNKEIFIFIIHNIFTSSPMVMR